ncbi:MAG TPA: hypothetical protein VHC70_14315 [Phycisphaerales bacterium]|jgi:hypothetical protein|nr:hypothetical protein [Phycisphaerales bacterium]
MSTPEERSAVVATTETAFHAETIAAALRDRGVEARVADAGTLLPWGGVDVRPEGRGVHVVVRESDRANAIRTLEQLREESASIDWDAADLGSDPTVERIVQVSRTRRWVWTVAVLLVPIGLFVLAYATTRNDRIVQILGGTLLLAAIVMIVMQLFPSQEDSNDSDD